MTRLWADGYDIYASANDLALRYTTYASASLVAAANTAFNTGQGVSNLTATKTFETTSNETTFYFSVRLKYGSAITNNARLYSLTFYDTTNAQVTISWLGDGSIQIRSGGVAGTLLATYTGAFSLNTWDSWQGKIVINNTTGSVSLRKNGAGSDTYALTGANTRGGSGNSYANGVGVAMDSLTWIADDFWMNNDDGTAPTGWPLDWRSIQQVVNGAGGSTQFTPSATAFIYGGSSTLSSFTLNANTLHMRKFTATVGGTVSAITLNLASNATGHVIGAIYDTSGSGGAPGLMQDSSVVTNPTAGSNTITLSGTVTLVRGQSYFIAVLADVALSIVSSNANTGAGVLFSESTSYSGGFPNPGVVVDANAFEPNVTISVTPSNWSLVSETLEDGDTTYVYSATVNQEDLYTLSALGVTASSIAGVEVFCYVKKSDSGPRSVSLRYIAAGSSDTDEGTLALSNTYNWITKFLPLDPVGGSWTQAHAEGANIGVKVTA